MYRVVLVALLAMLLVSCDGGDGGDDGTPVATRTRRAQRTPIEGTVTTPEPLQDRSLTPVVRRLDLPAILNPRTVWVATISGEVSEVTPRSGGYSDLHWVHGGRLAFAGILGDEAGIFAWDGRAVSSLAPVPGGLHAWSHDGRRLAYVRRDGDGPGTLHVLNLETGSSRQLATGLVGSQPPLWSWDDVRLAYAAGVTASPGVFLVGSDGGSPRLISPAAGSDVALAWSPNGRFVLFLRTLPDGSRALHLAEWDQTKDVLLGEVTPPDDEASAGSLAAWSPNGRFIAWNTAAPGQAGAAFVLDTATAESYQVADAPAGLAWAPNSQWLALSGADGTALRPSDNTDPRPVTSYTGTVTWSPGSTAFIVSGDGGTALVEIEGGRESALSEGPSTVAWSPDSQRVAVAGEGGILLVTRGGDAARISDQASPLLAWSPGGESLAFCLSGEVALFTLPQEASTRLAGTGCDAMPAWSPDGSRLAGVRADDAAVSHLVIDMDTGEAWAYPPEAGASLLWSPRLDHVAIQWPGSSELSLASSDGQDVLHLAERTMAPAWAPNGDYLAWLSDGAVQVIAPGEAGPIMLLPDGVRAFAWCDDGRGIVAAAGDSLLLLQGFDTEPRRLEAPAGIAFNLAPSSADCTTAVAAGESAANSDLYLLRGTDLLQMTATTEQESRPAVSPDGFYVAFTRTYADGSDALSVQALDGSMPPVVLPLREAGSPSYTWLDSTHIAYLSPDGVAVLDVSTREPAILAPADAAWWSAGGRHALIERQDGLYRLARGDGGEQMVVRLLPCQRVAIEGLSGDGRRVGLRVGADAGCAGG